jgi:hypothetical protein
MARVRCRYQPHPGAKALDVDVAVGVDSDVHPRSCERNFSRFLVSCRRQAAGELAYD